MPGFFVLTGKTFESVPEGTARAPGTDRAEKTGARRARLIRDQYKALFRRYGNRPPERVFLSAGRGPARGMHGTDKNEVVLKKHGVFPQRHPCAVFVMRTAYVRTQENEVACKKYCPSRQLRKLRMNPKELRVCVSVYLHALHIHAAFFTSLYIPQKHQPRVGTRHARGNLSCSSQCAQCGFAVDISEKPAMLPQYKDLQVGILRIIDGNGAQL